MSQENQNNNINNPGEFVEDLFKDSDLNENQRQNNSAPDDINIPQQSEYQPFLDIYDPNSKEEEVEQEEQKQEEPNVQTFISNQSESQQSYLESEKLKTIENMQNHFHQYDQISYGLDQQQFDQQQPQQQSEEYQFIDTCEKSTADQTIINQEQQESSTKTKRGKSNSTQDGLILVKAKHSLNNYYKTKPIAKFYDNEEVLNNCLGNFEEGLTSINNKYQNKIYENEEEMKADLQIMKTAIKNQLKKLHDDPKKPKKIKYGDRGQIISEFQRQRRGTTVSIKRVDQWEKDFQDMGEEAIKEKIENQETMKDYQN